MRDFEEKDYRVFDLFRNRWSLVTAGNMDRFNSCTLSWGSLGTLWTRLDGSGSVVTVYLHPARYTWDVMLKSGFFTVSFFSEQYRKALGIMGTVSGRNHDKTAESGLVPVAMGQGVTYREAELTFLCRKIYQHPFSKENLAEDIQEYYLSKPEVYPPDENGIWQPHWMFIGDILEVADKR